MSSFKKKNESKTHKLNISLTKIFNQISSEKTLQDGIFNLEQLFNENIKNEKNINYLFQQIQNQLLILKKENKKIIINILPYICSISPKNIYPFIDRILSIFQSSISNETKEIFPLIAKNFGLCSKILITIDDNKLDYNSNISSIEIPQDVLLVYTQFKLFCLTNIKSQNSINQTIGIICLNNFIENCPFNYMNNENLKLIWENLICLTDNNSFYPKIELLNCIISLIFLSEKKFSPYSTMTLYKIIDFITNQNWIIRKLALNIIYTLVYYCPEDIFPLKSFLLEFLESVKNDKNTQIKEVSIEIIDMLKDENLNIFNNDNNIFIDHSTGSLSDRSTVISGNLSNVSSKTNTKNTEIYFSPNFTFSNTTNDNKNINNKRNDIKVKKKRNSAIYCKSNNDNNKHYIKIKTLNNYHTSNSLLLKENRALNNMKIVNNINNKINNTPSYLCPKNKKIINVKYNNNNNLKVKTYSRRNSSIPSYNYNNNKKENEKIKHRKSNSNGLCKNNLLFQNYNHKRSKTPSCSKSIKDKINSFSDKKSIELYKDRLKISLTKKDKNADISFSNIKCKNNDVTFSFSNEKSLNNSCLFSKYNNQIQFKNSPFKEKSINDNNILNESSRSIKDSLMNEIEKLKSQITSLNLEIENLRNKKDLKKEIKMFIKEDNFSKAFELACKGKNIQDLYYIIKHYQLNSSSSINYDKYNISDKLLGKILLVLSEDLLECNNLLVITNFIINTVVNKKKKINKDEGKIIGNSFNELYFKRIELGLSKEEIENIYQIVNFFIDY